ncbi:hypothetical protein HPB52_013255 [Rhipicephalus sanguineus]|uniref:Transmembrane protein n=1 Tax=Rhipicephalus sanguineus TaxID=34632 RepID=A0A9D4YPQ4_RHISA|nr:hypothetical protein HPB52_013255 [Rhipicephalus sanguineus]
MRHEITELALCPAPEARCIRVRLRVRLCIEAWSWWRGASRSSVVDSMEPELQTQVNLPVVLMNREGLYAIVAVLGVSILGCACVLTYSFTNYSKMKRNAEEVRNYMASRAKVAHERGAARQAVGGSKAATDRASVPVLPAKVEMEKQQGPISSENDTLASQSAVSAVATGLDTSGVARGDAQRPSVDEGGGNGDATSTVAAAVGKNAQLVYSIMAANVSWNATGHGSAEAA